MKEITAEDLMIPLDRYPHIPYWFTLRQAMAEMDKSQLEVDGRQSLPRMVLVFDEEYRLMGLVRRRDILKGIIPNRPRESSETDGEYAPSFRRDTPAHTMPLAEAIEHVIQRSEQRVSEVMVPIRCSVNHDTSLMQVVEVLIDHDTSLIPVLKDQSVVGVCRSVDILHTIVGLILK